MIVAPGYAQFMQGLNTPFFNFPEQDFYRMQHAGHCELSRLYKPQ